MNLDLTTIIIAISAAILSGMGTAIIAGISDNKKEKNRQIEREQDHLKIELTEWKDKYYSTLQDLIVVKSELENALRELEDLDFPEKEG
jgi:hypothetical protein